VSESIPHRRAAILVIDRDPERGKAIAAQLKSVGADAVHFYFYEGSFETDSSGSIPDTWDLALVHGTDAKLFIDQWKNLKRTIGRTIYYSGSGGHDSNIPYRAERIVRALAVSSAPITSVEAASLVRAAFDPTYQPSLLLPPARMPLLRSLSVLSALYLAVTAADAEANSAIRTPDAEAVDPEVLKKLGWSLLPEPLRRKLRNEPDGLPSHADEVKHASWWMQRLPLAARADLSRSLDAEIRLFQASTNQDATSIRDLANELVQGPDRTLPIGLVKRCYLALAAVQEL
jgi:hypothetical protein